MTSCHAMTGRILALLLSALCASVEAQTLGPEWVGVAATPTRVVSVDASRMERTELGASGWMAQTPIPGYEAAFDAAERRRLEAHEAEWADGAPSRPIAQTQFAFEADCDGTRLGMRQSVSTDSAGLVVASTAGGGPEWRPVSDGSASGAVVEAVCAWRESAQDEAVATNLFEADSVDVAPVLIGGMRGLMERVVYPVEDIQTQTQGRVVVRVVVGRDGTPIDLLVAESVSPGLDRAALEAVREARFTPGLVAGQPVPVVLTLPVIFRLRTEIRTIRIE